MRHNPYIEDPALLRRHLAACEIDGREMGDDAARAVASFWHDGQASAFYAFASSGHFDRSALLRELSDTIGRCYRGASPADRRQLDFFGTYCLSRDAAKVGGCAA